MAPSAYARRKSSIGIAVSVGVIALAGVFGWLYVQKAKQNPMSEDAILTADVVNMAASVAGRVESLAVRENQAVKRGDLLFTIEAEPYRLVLAQTQGDLGIAEAALEAQRRSIAAERTNAAIAAEQITRAQSNLALAEQTLKRLSALSPKGYVPLQQVDDARTLRDNARLSLAQAQKQDIAANQLISTLHASEALVEARRAAMALAARNLANTEVRAPHDGLVVGLKISTGEIIAPGQSIFTLINTDAWYASAAYRETELKGIRVGACARVYALADPSTIMVGKVEGIGWGVASEASVSLPRLLPYVPKTLNWVRIEQRFPVRIRLNDPDRNVMRMGGSAVAIIGHDRQC